MYFNEIDEANIGVDGASYIARADWKFIIEINLCKCLQFLGE